MNAVPTQLLMSRPKPQAKPVSPAARCLFGKSQGSLVKNMLDDVLVTERRRFISERDFDVYKEKPISTEQQENIEAGETPATRLRYMWKVIKAGEAPEFYFRVGSLKKCQEPRNLSKSPRRFANTRPQSEAESRLTPQKFFNASAIEESVQLPKPLAVHATSENALTVKRVTPSIRNGLCQRSPLSQRNHSEIRRALNFISISTRTAQLKSAVLDEDPNGGSPKPSTSYNDTTVRSPKYATSANSGMKQLKITDMATIRKPRSGVMKARKRLRLPDEKDASTPLPKSNKWTNESRE